MLTITKQLFMKSFSATVLFVAMFPALSSAAAITLEIPVFVDEVNTPSAIPVALLNPELGKKGFSKIPEKMIITDSDPFDYWSLDSQVSATLQKAGYPNGSLVFESVPASNVNGEFHTCYRGDAGQLAELVQNLSDGPYSDQLVVQGWKWKDRVVFLNQEKPDDPSEAKKLDQLFSQESSAWSQFDPTTDDVLILSSISDDGTDLNESLIPRCQ